MHRLRSTLFACLLLLSLGGVASTSPPFSRPASAHLPGSPEISQLSEKLLESVVNISISQDFVKSRSAPFNLPPDSPFQDFFDDFMERFQDRNRSEQHRIQSLGSGFVIDESGIIVTNHHVIAEADEIIVTLADGERHEAEVLGRDPKIDIALLKIDAGRPLKAVAFGDSDIMRVGEWVMAIGNPFGLGGTVTIGIVSARNRNINSGPYDDFIQTDAAINRGNSGGPLFNLKGEVIGINTAIISPSGGSVGVGFSVPAATALPIIEQLRRYGETRRGWLGVRIQTVTEAIAESLDMEKPRGALIAYVDEDSPASEAGLQIGDVIVSFDGSPVPSMSDLPRIVAASEIGKTVAIEVLRRGDLLSLSVTVGRLQENEQALNESAPPSKPPPFDLDGHFPDFGLRLAPLDDALRDEFQIPDVIRKGLAVTGVAADSVAAERDIRPGAIILEVDQTPMETLEDFRRSVEASREDGRKYILLLIAFGSHTDMRFITLPHKDD